MYSVFWTTQENEEWLRNKRLMWSWRKSSGILGQAQEEFPSQMRHFHGPSGLLHVGSLFFVELRSTVCINPAAEGIKGLWGTSVLSTWGPWETSKLQSPTPDQFPERGLGITIFDSPSWFVYFWVSTLRQNVLSGNHKGRKDKIRGFPAGLRSLGSSFQRQYYIHVMNFSKTDIRPLLPHKENETQEWLHLRRDCKSSLWKGHSLLGLLRCVFAHIGGKGTGTDSANTHCIQPCSRNTYI